MSQQLQISSLFSAFAIVCLCIFARADATWRVEGGIAPGSANGPIVQALSAAAAKR